MQSQAEATAQRTLDQLRESYPEVAHSLIPRFRTPPWHNLFKLDLESDDGIPLNKRGSGIRRLVLLSFFQAEAARKREERGSNVIYAIEEPEASQHPDNQEMIIMALQLEAYGLVDVRRSRTTEDTYAIFWNLTSKGEQMLLDTRVVK